MVLIDTVDFHYFENKVFRVIYGSTMKIPYLYIVTCVGGKFLYETFHRMIMKAGEDQYVDHINNSQSLDNRRQNLRLCNISQNLMNTCKRKSKSASRKYTSKFKGVHKNKKGQWICLVGTASKRERYVFDNEIKAAQKYNERAAVLFGEFANLNTIERSP